MLHWYSAFDWLNFSVTYFWEKAMTTETKMQHQQENVILPYINSDFVNSCVVIKREQNQLTVWRYCQNYIHNIAQMSQTVSVNTA